MCVPPIESRQNGAVAQLPFMFAKKSIGIMITKRKHNFLLLAKGIVTILPHTHVVTSIIKRAHISTNLERRIKHSCTCIWNAIPFSQGKLISREEVWARRQNSVYCVC